MINFKKKLLETARNAINLEIEEKTAYVKGGTRFGGLPDVPENFEWPFFECKTFDDEELKPRPLNFLLQINLEEFAPLDKDNLLPEKGLLSFFHVVESEYFPEENVGEDEKCLRVFYFEDISALKEATPPDGIDEGYYKIAPMLEIKAEAKPSYMDFEDFTEVFDCDYDEWDDFDKVFEKLNGGERDCCSKLLGWADVIQSSMASTIELNSRGHVLSTSEDYKKVKNELAEAGKTAVFDWVLLLQLDPVEDDGFELMYGDGGSLYVYIRREDLAARRFEKARFMWQCF